MKTNSVCVFWLEEKEDRWRKRLDGYLKPYGLHLQYFGYFPTIVYEDNRQAISIYFYE